MVEASGHPQVGRSPDDLCATGGRRVDSIEPATIDITTDPDGVRAWFAALTRS